MAGIVIYNACAGWAICAAFAAAAIVCFVKKRHWAAFACLFASSGWIVSDISCPEQIPETIYGQRLTWTAEISDIKEYPDAIMLTVDLLSVKRPNTDKAARLPSARCTILSPSSGNVYEYGEIIMFTGRLRHPGSSDDLPDETVGNSYFVNGISAEADIAPDHIMTTGKFNRSLRRSANILRDKIQDLIYLSPIDSPTAWFLSAIMLGDDSMLDRDVKEQFRATGVAHYLALSGFHVGIIAMLASLMLLPFKTWSHADRMRHLAVIILVWTYTSMCGMAASLVRASVLITIFMSAKMLQRQSSPFNSLAVAAVVILCFAPRQLYAPGFQLSFMAVLSILVLAPVLNPVSRRRPIVRKVAGWIAVTISATIGTCLISMIHFHRLPLLFLIPNLLLALLLPILIGCGIIMMIATACGLSLTWIGWLSDRIYGAAEGFCRYVSTIDHCEIDGIYLPTATIVFGAVAIILLAAAVRLGKRPYALWAASMIAATIASAIILSPELPTDELFITRRPLRTDIIIRHDKTCKLITTAPIEEHSDICRSLSRKYNNYLAKHGCIDPISPAYGDFDIGSFSRRGNYLIADDKVIALAFDESTAADCGVHTDYLLATRAAGNEILSLLKRFRADTVLVSADMPPKRAMKIQAISDSLKLHCRMIHEKPFVIHIN